MKLRKVKLRKVKLSVTHAYVRSAFRHRCRVSLTFFLLTAAHSPFFLHIAVRTLVFFSLFTFLLSPRLSETSGRACQ